MFFIDHLKTQNELQRMNSELVSLRNILERIETNLLKNPSSLATLTSTLSNDRPVSHNKKFTFPIHTSQLLHDFELELKNEAYKLYLVNI